MIAAAVAEAVAQVRAEAPKPARASEDVFAVVADADNGERQVALRAYNLAHKVAGKYCAGGEGRHEAHGFAYAKSACPRDGGPLA